MWSPLFKMDSVEVKSDKAYTESPAFTIQGLPEDLEALISELQKQKR